MKLDYFRKKDLRRKIQDKARRSRVSLPRFITVIRLDEISRYRKTCGPHRKKS